MAATVTTWKRGTTLQTLIGAGGNVANNALAISSAITLTDAGYLLADVVFVGTFNGVPNANSGLACWALREDGSSNYEDGSTSVTPARAVDFVIPVRAVNTQQDIIVQAVLPPGPFTVLVLNNATGQQLNSVWTLKLFAYTYTQG